MAENMPQDIMSEAAGLRDGLLITFTSAAQAKRFRFRCYACKRRESERLAREALVEGTPLGSTGWEDLVFLLRTEISSGVANKLWIGIPNDETFGIVSVKKGKT